MNRRDFLRGLVGGVAAAAAVRTWPFRVFSFPEKIVVPTPLFLLRPEDIKAIELEHWAKQIPDLIYNGHTLYDRFKLMQKDGITLIGEGSGSSWTPSESH